MTLCAIHQPTFFPWLGYFDKIKRSDIFVFLDRAAYQKSGSSMGCWCNRVRINVSGQGTWISAPAVREHGVQPIHTVRIDNTRPWRDALRKAIETNYRKARNHAAVFPFLDGLIGFETDMLADFNINAITRIATYLGLETNFVREIDLPEVDALATDRLIRIVQVVGAQAYMSGAAAADYLDESAFRVADIELVHQRFTPQPYGPPDKYIAGLSVIDYLMHRDG